MHDKCPQGTRNSIQGSYQLTQQMICRPPDYFPHYRVPNQGTRSMNRPFNDIAMSLWIDGVSYWGISISANN